MPPRFPPKAKESPPPIHTWVKQFNFSSHLSEMLAPNKISHSPLDASVIFLGMPVPRFICIQVYQILS